MSRKWKVAIVKDTMKPMLGGHGLHVAFCGLPGVLNVRQESAGYSLALHAMLKREKPDIVVLSSRHPADHLVQIRIAAEHGCHIYCEKPASALLTEIDEMERIADAYGIRLAMAHPARHDLGFLTMKRLVESGEIGTPHTVLGRGKCDHRGGGEDLIVLGTHILDVQAFFFGAPQRVMAEVYVDGRKATLDDVAVATTNLVEPVGPAVGDEIFTAFRFAGGVRGTFETRRGLAGTQADSSIQATPGTAADADPAIQAAPPASSIRKNGSLPTMMGLSVIGTKGTLSLRFDDQSARRPPLLICQHPGFPDAETRYEEVPLTEQRSIPGADPLDFALCGQPDIPAAHWFLEAGRFAAWDLIRAIEEDRPPVSGIHNARIVAEMIQGIYASHLSGRAIPFPLADRRHPLAPVATGSM